MKINKSTKKSEEIQRKLCVKHEINIADLYRKLNTKEGGNDIFKMIKF
jgi:hypothetical protein